MGIKVLAFLNSNLGLLVVGFLLTGVLGASLNWLIQKDIWERQRKHQLLLRRISSGKELFDEVSTLFSRRGHGLYTVFRAIEENASADDVKKSWADYNDVVRQWNAQLYGIRLKLELSAGKAIAAEFYDYADEAASEAPKSIHYKMRKAHMKVRSLVSGSDLSDISSQISEAEAMLDGVLKDMERFLRSVSFILLKLNDIDT